MIYYVEDDANIRNLTLYALSAQGLEAHGFKSAKEFMEACQTNPPDLVLLDIMLPGEDGLSVLSWIRSSSNIRGVPVMMLTAKDSELDTVRALDGGADDYLAKPFGMMEMVSRVRALMRRCGVSLACARHILADYARLGAELRACPTYGFVPINAELRG